MTEQDRLLVWMAGVPWDGVRGTDRQLATAMAQYARILWVDPPVSPVSAARQHNITGQSFRPTLSVVNDRITRLTPIAMPGRNRPGLRTAIAALGRSQVKWALRCLDVRPHAVVVTHFGEFLGYWGPDVVNVLYGTDDYVAGAELMGLSADYLRRQEMRALARADMVAAVSPELTGRWASLGADPLLIPNGCWPSRSRAEVTPIEIQDIPRPIIGLIGQLSDRIDLDVLNSIADAGFSLLMVGPLDPRWEGPRFKTLVSRNNVRYVGAVPAESVPSYLSAIDIGVTPYRDSLFNRASFPLKTLEYLGAGLPVVSADLPAARWLLSDLACGEHASFADQILAIAPGNAEFVDAIHRIAAYSLQPQAGKGATWHGRDPVSAERCIAFAARHSWSRRAEVFAAALGLSAAGGRAG